MSSLNNNPPSKVFKFNKTSLYDYLKNDRENVLGRIGSSLIKQLYLPPSVHADAMSECILAFMETEYEPLYDNGSIISYAYQTARLRLVEWRRRTLLCACTTRVERPEPFGVSIDQLTADDIDLMMSEIEHLQHSPLDELLKADELENGTQEPELTINDVQLPPDNKGKKNYRRILEMLSEGKTVEATAQELGINKRTVYRHLRSIKEYNSGGVHAE